MKMALRLIVQDLDSSTSSWCDDSGRLLAEWNISHFWLLLLSK